MRGQVNEGMVKQDRDFRVVDQSGNPLKFAEPHDEKALVQSEYHVAE